MSKRRSRKGQWLVRLSPEDQIIMTPPGCAIETFRIIDKEELLDALSHSSCAPLLTDLDSKSKPEQQQIIQRAAALYALNAKSTS